LIENLNSGGFQWDETCLATDGTVVCLRHSAWLQGKVKQGEGSVSNFVENLRERGTEGLWPHNGFSVLNVVENPERNDTDLTHKLLLFCFRDIPKTSQTKKISQIWTFEDWSIETTTPVTGLQVQTVRPQYPFVFPPRRRAF